jgi:hypothetical protein
MNTTRRRPAPRVFPRRLGRVQGRRSLVEVDWRRRTPSIINGSSGDNDRMPEEERESPLEASLESVAPSEGAAPAT